MIVGTTFSSQLQPDLDCWPSYPSPGIPPASPANPDIPPACPGNFPANPGSFPASPPARLAIPPNRSKPLGLPNSYLYYTALLSLHSLSLSILSNIFFY